VIDRELLAALAVIECLRLGYQPDDPEEEKDAELMGRHVRSFIGLWKSGEGADQVEALREYVARFSADPTLSPAARRFQSLPRMFRKPAPRGGGDHGP
jgi:hypothetical protein